MAELSDVTEALQKQTAATLKISVETLKERQAQKKANDESRTKLEELKESIEAAGGVAEESRKYNKLLYEQEKAENELRKKSADTSAEEKEKRLEARALAAKTGNLLKKIASGIGGLAKASLQTAKKVGGGIFNFLKKALLGAALIGLLLFLDDENWEKIKTLAADGVIWLKNKAVPFWKNFKKFIESPTWDNLIKLFGLTEEFANKIENVFKKIEIFFKDPSLKTLGGIFNMTEAEMQDLKDKVIKYSLTAGAVALALPVMLGALMTIGGLVTWAGWKTISGRLLGGGAATGLVGATGFKKGGFFKKLLKFGAVFSLVLGAVDGVEAGVDEFKKSGDMQKSVVAGLAGMVNSITWGLISEEASKAFMNRVIRDIETGGAPSQKQIREGDPNIDHLMRRDLDFFSDPNAYKTRDGSMSTPKGGLYGMLSNILGYWGPPDLKKDDRKVRQMAASFQPTTFVETVTNLRIPPLSGKDYGRQVKNSKKLVDDMFRGQFLSPSTKIKRMGHKLELEGADISEVKAKKLSVLDFIVPAAFTNEQRIATMSLAMARRSISAGAPDIHIEAPSVTSATSSNISNQYVTRPLHHPDPMLGLVNAAV
jgi:hypothetical protein